MKGRRKRRLKIIDQRFQLKTAFTIIGIILIAYTVVIATTGIIISYNNKNLTIAITDLSKSVDNENAIVTKLLKHADRDSGKDGPIDRGEIRRYHGETMSLIQSRVSILQRIAAQNRVLIMVTILMGILLGVTLFFYLVNFTHRIAGPIYVLSRHVQDIIDGKEPDFRELRKNDEFKEFYAQFIEMVEKIRNT